MFTLSSYFTLAVAFVVYAAAALPWVLAAFFKREQIVDVFHDVKTNFFGRRVIVLAGAAVLAVVVVPFLLQYVVAIADPRLLSGFVGIAFGPTLQLQLIVDFFLVGFPLLFGLWPNSC